MTTEVQFFAVKSVSSSSPSLLGGYLAPFSPSTWATAAAALLVLPLALAVTSRGKVGFAQSFGITLSILLQHDQASPVDRQTAAAGVMTTLATTARTKTSKQLKHNR